MAGAFLQYSCILGTESDDDWSTDQLNAFPLKKSLIPSFGNRRERQLQRCSRCEALGSNSWIVVGQLKLTVGKTMLHRRHEGSDVGRIER